MAAHLPGMLSFVQERAPTTTWARACVATLSSSGAMPLTPSNLDMCTTGATGCTILATRPCAPPEVRWPRQHVSSCTRPARWTFAPAGWCATLSSWTSTVLPPPWARHSCGQDWPIPCRVLPSPSSLHTLRHRRRLQECFRCFRQCWRHHLRCALTGCAPALPPLLGPCILEWATRTTASPTALPCAAPATWCCGTAGYTKQARVYSCACALPTKAPALTSGPTASCVATELSPSARRNWPTSQRLSSSTH